MEALAALSKPRREKAEAAAISITGWAPTTGTCVDSGVPANNSRGWNCWFLQLLCRPSDTLLGPSGVGKDVTFGNRLRLGAR